jgi:hypothetical protein
MCIFIIRVKHFHSLARLRVAWLIRGQLLPQRIAWR